MLAARADARGVGAKGTRPGRQMALASDSTTADQRLYQDLGGFISHIAAPLPFGRRKPRQPPRPACGSGRSRRPPTLASSRTAARAKADGTAMLARLGHSRHFALAL
jgi:hypothetical protein